MSYVSREMKQKLSPKIKAILAKYRVKGSLSVRNHSALVLTIKSGEINFIGNFNRVAGNRVRPAHLPFQPARDHINVNCYWYHEHFDGAAREFLREMIDAMKGPDYFDHSDAQTDYFHCSHYIDITIGRWDRPYMFV